MKDLGTRRPGSTIYCPFATFDSNDPSASVTLTGLAVTGIEIYKNGSVTQRASDTGYTLLDTDGIDFDSLTGIHGFSIDLSSDADAGFYVAGAEYFIVVNGLTVDAATVRFVYGNFRIGYPGAILDTTIATLASQTSFTLTAGPADNNALNGMPCIIHDKASGVQIAKGIISAYTGASRTVTLDADPGIFTMAVGDNISVFIGDALNPTARANIESAGDNYSATRGLAGTALPAAAAGAAGGLPTDSTGKTAFNDLSAAQVNAEVDSALDTAVPGSPTAGSINERIKTMDDADMPASLTTLLNRITSTIFAGITSLAEWLGLLAGKQVGNATARTEIRATGAGAGTFDETTDSQEAIRDHVGDGTNLTEAGGTGDQLTAVAQASVCTEARLAELDAANIPTDLANIEADTAVIGAAGAGLTEAGGTGDHLTAIPWNAAWDAEVESEVNDAIDTAISELGVAAPTATPTIRTALMLMYMALRNKLVVQTSGTDAIEIYNDAGTKIASKLITDDGSDYTEAEMA